METSDSSERHALVTGTSSGIGAAIAGRLLQRGWRVTGLDIAPPTLRHSDFGAIEVDLCDERAIDDATRSVPPVQALVHAAGVLRVAPLGALVPQDGRLMWQLHVDAATRLADRIVPAMAAAGHGRVVLVGSRVAGGVAGRSQYAATKAALISLARSWAAEVVSRGVTVNVVSPAATETAMLADPERRGTAPRLPPIGRLIRPDEVAALVCYLLGDDAAAITGQDLRICGGASLAG